MHVFCLFVQNSLSYYYFIPQNAVGLQIGGVYQKIQTHDTYNNTRYPYNNIDMYQIWIRISNLNNDNKKKIK